MLKFLQRLNRNAGQWIDDIDGVTSDVHMQIMSGRVFTHRNEPSTSEAPATTVSVNGTEAAPAVDVPVSHNRVTGGAVDAAADSVCATAAG
jgi:hypothetical protein